MVYVYWVGALTLLGALMVALPLLSSNKAYRTATLFAGMTTGIISLSYFIHILRWGIGPAGEKDFAVYFMTSLPNLYIASLLVGSTIVSKCYLNASTRFRAAAAILACIVALHLLSIIVSRILGILLMTLFEGIPNSEFLSETISHASTVAIHPNFYAVVILFLAAFIALNGTATIMRLSDKDAGVGDETGRPEA